MASIKMFMVPIKDHSKKIQGASKGGFKITLERRGLMVTVLEEQSGMNTVGFFTLKST